MVDVFRKGSLASDGDKLLISGDSAIQQAMKTLPSHAELVAAVQNCERAKKRVAKMRRTCRELGINLAALGRDEDDP